MKSKNKMNRVETKKAYCGRCKHWRLMKESEIESEYDREMAKHGEVTRAECAMFENGKRVCVLGICKVSGARNFNDEMYDFGGSDDCHYWCNYFELWGGADNNGE